MPVNTVTKGKAYTAADLIAMYGISKAKAYRIMQQYGYIDVGSRAIPEDRLREYERDHSHHAAPKNPYTVRKYERRTQKGATA